MNTTLTTEMIHVLDHLLAESLRFGEMSVAETRELTSLGTAHDALIAAGVKIGNTLLLDLYAQHAEHRSQGITDLEGFNPPAWNPLLAAEGVRQIAEYCQADRSSAMTTFNIDLGAKSTDRDAVEVLNEIVRDRIATLQPECQARWEQERRVFTQTKLTCPLVELRRFIEGLREASHRLQVVGSAAGSMVLHAMGLSPLCPLEHGFHLERFIDPDGAAIQELQVTGLVSMNGLELLKFLWKQGFTTRVFQHETKVNGEFQKLEHIGAKHEGEHREGPRLILQIVTPSDMAIVNSLSPEQMENCLHDPATWELLGRGDTSGITNLDNAVTQEMLRKQKPRSLAELAAVMISHGPGREEGGLPEYQEDLMSELHREAGMPLREAYEFIRHAARNKPEQLEVAAENLMRRAQSSGIEESSTILTLKSIQTKSRHALCKAHIFTMAHLALQTAYVKAHHRDEFRAVTSVLRSESPQ